MQNLATLQNLAALQNLQLYSVNLLTNLSANSAKDCPAGSRETQEVHTEKNGIVTDISCNGNMKVV